MSVGTLTLHRFNGDEVFNVSDADIRYFAGESGVVVNFEVKTEDNPVKTLPDTEDLNGWPSGAWQLSVSDFDPSNLVGKTFLIPDGYDEEAEEYRTNFYYVEHEPINGNVIAFTGWDGDEFQVQITGMVTDVNHYDGSEPATKVVIQAKFSLARSEEPIDPIG